MPDEKPSDDDLEAIAYLEQLRDRPIAAGSVAELAVRARRGDFDDAIRESKTTPGLDGAPDEAQVEPSTRDAEREHTEAIKESKSSATYAPFEGVMEGVAESVNDSLSVFARQTRLRQAAQKIARRNARTDGFQSVPTAPGETPTHASTLDKYWSQDPLIKDSPGVADRAIEMREEAERATVRSGTAANLQLAVQPAPSSPTERIAVVGVCAFILTTCVTTYFTAVQVAPRDSEGGANFWPYPWLYVVAAIAALCVVVAFLSWTGRDRPPKRRKD